MLPRRTHGILLLIISDSVQKLNPSFFKIDVYLLTNSATETTLLKYYFLNPLQWSATTVYTPSALLGRGCATCSL
jgi:hypothetical protein